MDEEIKIKIWYSLIIIFLVISSFIIILGFKQIGIHRCYSHTDVYIDSDARAKTPFTIGSYYIIDNDDNYIHFADFGAKSIDMMLRQDSCVCSTSIDWHGEFKWWFKGSDSDGRCYEWQKRLDCKCYIGGTK